MRKLLILCAVCLLLVFPVVANATSISVAPSDWSGLGASRSTDPGDGIEAKDGWSGTENNGFEISWDISYDGSLLLYTYEYTVSGVGDNYLTFGLSHLNVQVTEPSNLYDFNMLIAEAVDSTVGSLTEYSIPFEGPDTFEPSDGSGSNPNMPDDIYAIKWNMDGNDGIFGLDRDILEYSITFTSEKEPVWGNFYAKDGKHVGIVAEAWNIGFLETPTETSDFIRWIATPDGGNGSLDPGGNPIPEPATMLLLGSGLIGIAVSGKKKFKKRNG